MRKRTTGKLLATSMIAAARRTALWFSGARGKSMQLHAHNSIVMITKAAGAFADSGLLFQYRAVRGSSGSHSVAFRASACIMLAKINLLFPKESNARH